MISREQLKEILLSQRKTILSRSFGVERTVLLDVERKALLPHVVVITGMRRCGKSTLLRQIMGKYYVDEHFYYVTFEDERLRGFPANQFNVLYETLIELFGEQKVFFLDEVQNVEGFEGFVRRFYDQGFKFYLTGSNAKLLSRELGTKLTGRHVDILVRPFSFEEFLRFRGVVFREDMFYVTEKRALLKKLFDEYLLQGGMPEYISFNDPELLTRVYEDIVLKDVVVRYNLADQAVVRELYLYLVTNFATRFSFRSLQRFVTLGSVNTIKKYVSYLEETYFLRVILKFDYSLRKQMVNERKAYIIDQGFLPLLASKATLDKGRVLELLVLGALRGEVFYFSGKKECDFVVRERNVMSVVQVSWELGKNREREIEGLIEAMIALKLKKGLILTYDQEESLVFEGKKVTVMPVWKWLLGNSQI